jgi:molybdate transport system regulatory protein
MSAAVGQSARDWRVGLRLWLERSGRPLLGQGRAALLEKIHQAHSIRQAAQALGMSYRRAWLLVQAMNQAAGQPLVVAAAGGRHGGGARLTPLGEQILAHFQQLTQEVQQAAAAALTRLQRPAAAALHLLAAASLEEVVGRLLAEFRQEQPAVPVRALFGASDELVEHLLSGARADVVISADRAQLDRLQAAGMLAPGTRCVVAANRLVLLSRKERVLPIKQPADLAHWPRLRLGLAATPTPLGRYSLAWLEHLGLAAALLPQALLLDSASAVLAAVRGGQVDVGLVYASQAHQAADCQELCRSTPARPPIRYEAALLAGPQLKTARLLWQFFRSPRARRQLRACGFLVPAADQTT